MTRNRTLPPLGPLRGFEAAARLGSFTQAASELHLTQTAISHQVRSLEVQLGQQLFDRSGRQPELTTQGTQLQQLCTEYFDRMDTLCKEMKAGNKQKQPLRISLAPAFASRWLTPRLADFWAANDIPLDLIPSAAIVDISKENIDLAIRCGNGNWPGLIAERLMPVRETPLCAPSLLTGQHPLAKPSDLRHHTLLHERDQNGWTQWLDDNALVNEENQAGIVCHDSIMLYDLMVAGQGIGLGSYSIIEKELGNGTLVAPFGMNTDPDHGYYLVYREGALHSAEVSAFRQFLLDACQYSN